MKKRKGLERNDAPVFDDSDYIDSSDDDVAPPESKKIKRSDSNMADPRDNIDVGVSSYASAHPNTSSPTGMERQNAEKDLELEMEALSLTKDRANSCPTILVTDASGRPLSENGCNKIK
jgi:hypothetical protein